MHEWLVLTYKLPSEPSAKRVYIWRKLKRIGALLHQDSCWVLPSNARTREQFQWLAAEIIEMGGETTFWEGRVVLGTSDQALAQIFNEQVEEPYLEILNGLEEEEPDLESLSRLYQQNLARDYFNSESGQQARKALLAARSAAE